ncbi:MAG: M23 family metallopeptidase [Treponema sp.]|nr:M23 family metallopeptidase [Treponema sp.]
MKKDFGFGKKLALNKKKYLVAGTLAVTLLGTAAALFAFSWPQAQTNSDTFHSYFGQLRGGTISSSLIFKDNSEVKTADPGDILAVIDDHTEDYGWFESTLGNAVIIGHSDQRVTIYANLDEESIPSSLGASSFVSTGTPLGTSGNSGWQEGESCLKFQVLDTKSGISINPRMLMPKIGAELPVSMGYITLDDEKGTTHYLVNERNLKAGTYYIYKTRDATAVPFRTIVAINGATVERISYDTLKEYNGRLCITGNNNYPVELMYPDDTRLLLGKISLPYGHVGLSVTVVDMLNSAQSVTYNLDVN